MQRNMSFRQQLQSGAFWTVSMRWGMKFIGLASTAVLARLLAPEDYGLVAIALVLIAGVQVFFDLGIELSLIRDANATNEDFNTAWTMRLLQANGLGLVIILLAEVAGDFYQDQRLAWIFYVSALSIMIKSFENIGVVEFQKDLDFFSDFKFRVVSKIIGTICTLGLAYYLRSYKALILGLLIQHAFSTTISYIVSAYRPRFTLSKWRDLWGFSKWILVKNFSNYLSNQGEYLVTSKVAPMAEIGHFRWARELNALVSSELMQPIARVAAPGFAKIEHDSARLLHVYRRSLNIIASISAPLVLGVGAVAVELVPLFLGGGDKWMAVVPILELLCFAAFFSCLYRLSNTYFVVTGKVKYTAYIDIARSIISVAAVYPCYLYAGFIGVAFASIVITFLVMVAYHFLLCRETTITFSDIVKDVGRPALSSLVMFVVLDLLGARVALGPVAMLSAKVVVGALVYSASLYLLWLASARPESLESELLSSGQKLWRRLNA